MKYFAAIILAASLAACSPSGTNENHAGEHAAPHEAGITITNAALRPPLPGRTMAAAYFTLNNNSEADRLLSVESPISERVEIHTHLNEDGVMKMRKLDGLDLAAGETTAFKPGGHHIMLFDTTLTDAATEVPLTLNFEKAGGVTVAASVLGRGATDVTDHSGH